GVKHCIDYTKHDFAEEVKKLTNGEGVDLVLDALGGSALKKSYASLRRGGRLFTFGFSSATPTERRSWLTIVSEFMRMPKFSPLDLMETNRAVLGVDMNGMSQRPEIVGRELDDLVELFK